MKRTEQPLGSADKRITAFVESQQLVSRASDADAHGFSDWAGRPIHFSQPERAGAAKIESVVPAINLQGGGQAARSTGQIEKPSRLAILAA